MDKKQALMREFAALLAGRPYDQVCLVTAVMAALFDGQDGRMTYDEGEEFSGLMRPSVDLEGLRAWLVKKGYLLADGSMGARVVLHWPWLKN